MIETNRIEFKRELTKDLDLEKEDIFGESLGSGMASVMKSYSPANFTFFPHFVRFSVEYINHAILSMESKTSESGRISAPLNAESGPLNAESGRINAEIGRINAETGRINAESGPLNAESGPLNAESGPLNAESGPLNAESGRINAESGRINAESGRINAESGRINAESDRINAKTVHLTKNEAKILHIITKEEGLSVINLQLKTELAERTIFRHIASLTQKLLIERRGSKKTGGYWLVDSSHIEK